MKPPDLTAAALHVRLDSSSNGSEKSCSKAKRGSGSFCDPKTLLDPLYLLFSCRLPQKAFVTRCSDPGTSEPSRFVFAAADGTNAAALRPAASAHRSSLDSNPQLKDFSVRLTADAAFPFDSISASTVYHQEEKKSLRNCSKLKHHQKRSKVKNKEHSP